MLTRRCRCCAPPPRAEAPLIAGSPPPGDGPGGSHGSFPMLAAVLRDPTLTGVDRLPMRTTAAPFPTSTPARSGSPSRRRGGDRWMATGTSASSTACRRFPARSSRSRAVHGGRSTSRRMDDPTGQRRQPVRAAPLHQRDHGLRRRPARRTRGDPVGVHRRLVEVPASWAGRRVVLRVGAAESVVAAYIDGACVGVGTDSRLPNEFDITSHVQAGRSASVVLLVVRWSAATWLEDQDQWWHGGIQRGVSLYSTAPTHLADMKALPGLAAPGGPGPRRQQPDPVTAAAWGSSRARSTWSSSWTVPAVGPRGSPSRRSSRRCVRMDRPGVVWPAPVRSRCPPRTRATRSRSCSAPCSSSPASCGHGWRCRTPPWSHETPTRYRVVTMLRDPGVRSSRWAPSAPGSARSR